MTGGRLPLYAAVALPATFLLATVGYPLGYALVTSLYRLNLARQIDVFVGLGNYVAALHDDLFWSALRVTFEFTIVSTAIEFALGMALALALYRRPRFQNVIRTVVLIPMFMAPVVVGLDWSFIYDPSFGPLNWLLGVFGVPPQTWLGSGRLALPALIAVDVWQQTGVMFVILLAGLQAISPEYWEAAAIDGAGSWTSFRHVTWPLLLPSTVVALTLRTMFALRTFDLMWVTTGGGPGVATQTLSVYMYKVGFSQFDLGYANTLSVLLLLVIGAVSVLYASLLRAPAT